MLTQDPVPHPAAGAGHERPVVNGCFRVGYACSMPPRSHRKLLLDFAFAASLVAFGVIVVISWLFMALLAMDHALEPWSNAGILLYGPGFILLATIFGVPGSAWARGLSEEFSMPWSRRAQITARIGSCVLRLGGALAVAALVAAIA